MADNASRLRGAGSNASRLRGSGAPNAFMEFGQQFGGKLLDIFEPFAGPSRYLEEKMSGVDPERYGTFREQADIPEPSGSLPGRMGSLAGEAAAIALPIGGAATRVPMAAKGAGRLRTAFQNMLSGYGIAFRAAPVTTTAIEAGLGATAAAGGYVAEENFPETDAARFVGEILGGAGPGLAQAGARETVDLARRAARAAPVSGWIARRMDEVKTLLSPQTASRRATERMGRGTADAPGAAAAMEEDLLPGLTPAGQTGERGLLSMERSVNDALNDADRFLEDSIDTVNHNIKNAIASFEGSPEATQDAYLKAQNELKEWLDGRVDLAALRTEQTLAEISPNASRETVNRVAAKELRGALESARVEERALYELIPMKAVVPTNNAKRMYREILSQTSQAELDDIPSVAKTFLGRQGDKKFGAQTTIKEMRGLQSKLRQVARNSRSGDNANLNRARIADMIADSITDDIAKTEGGEEVAGLVQAAVGYSRNLNEKFRKGTVGSLLGFAKQGEARVPEGLMLESSIGLTGPRAREAFDDIIKATDSPEVNAAMEDYIKNRFFANVVEEGQINRSKANLFMKNNAEVLGRLPKVNEDINRAMQSLDVQDLRMAQRGRVSFDKPSVSRATMFIEKGPERAFRDVLGARSPRREMINLVNMAKRDSTGEALEGLKSAFSDHISKTAMSGDFISGGRLDDFLTNPKNAQAMRALYSPAEISRWRVINNTAKRLDLQRAAKPSGEGVMRDKPGQIATVLARLIGARSGTSIAQSTGIGGIQAQAIMSERFKEMLESGLDPARQLVMDAVQDRGLFREVLLAEIKPDGTIPEQARRRLNAWIATLGEDEE